MEGAWHCDYLSRTDLLAVQASHGRMPCMMRVGKLASTRKFGFRRISVFQLRMLVC